MVRAIRLAQAAARKKERWQIVVSSDGPGILRLAQQNGAIALRRPKSLAQDRSPLSKAMLHALKTSEVRLGSFDEVLMLSPATPLTRVRDIRSALNLFRKGNGASVASVVQDSHGPSARFQLNKGCLDRSPRSHRVGRRQEGDPQVLLNGAIYVASPGWLRRYGQFVRAGQTIAYRMPQRFSLDIESAQDLAWAAFLMRQPKPGSRLPPP